MPVFDLYICPFPDRDLYREYEEEIENTYTYDYNEMINDINNTNFVTKFGEILLNTNSDPQYFDLRNINYLFKNNRQISDNNEALRFYYEIDNVNGNYFPFVDLVETDGTISSISDSFCENSIYKLHYNYYCANESNANESNESRNYIMFSSPNFENNHYNILRKKYSN
jgi:hypothetical protein